MFKRFLFFSLLILAAAALPAQGPTVPSTKLPTVIPPSPEIGQLVAVGSLSTGMHTGSANVNIPLYTVPVKGVSLNVALTYNSNGIKVDEIPGRAGMGWNLVAGGVISRVVHDEPDEDGPFLAPPDPILPDAALYTYLKYVSQEGYDNEHDEYSYSFNGQSGKFFLDAEGNGHCIPDNNMKVKKQTGSFTITTADGTVYYFGENYRERTRSLNVQGGAGTVTKNKVIVTGWFLESIVAPGGNTIDFSYSPIFIKTETNRFETRILPKRNEIACSDDGTYPQASWSYGTNYMEYDTYYLTAINSSSGISIDFTYEDRPDAAGDNRLTGVNVKDADANYLKRFRMTYFDPPSSVTWNHRFFLTKLTEFGEKGSPAVEKVQDYDFEYVNIAGMAPRLDNGQDYFGYQNEAIGQTYLAPAVPNLEVNVLGASTGANRKPADISYTSRGMLKKLTYPTGGYEEFTYETHTKSVTETYNYHYEDKVEVDGVGTLLQEGVWANSQGFKSLYNQVVEVEVTISGVNGGIMDTYGYVAIYNGLNLVGDSVKFSNYGTFTFTVTLEENKFYYAHAIVYREGNKLQVNLKHNYNTRNGTYNKNLGGVRVRSIKAFDPVSNTSNTKYYTYANVALPYQSSGIQLTSDIFYEWYLSGTECTLPIVHTGTYDGLMISSNSMMPNFSLGGSHVAYGSVIESDDPDFKNGCTEHAFSTVIPSTSTQYQYVGASNLNTPHTLSTDFNGIEYQTLTYKMSEGKLVPVRQVNNNYSIGGTSTIFLDNYSVRRRFSYIQETELSSMDLLNSFDMTSYRMSGEFLKLASTVVKDFDAEGNNPLTTTTNYTYDYATHLQPITITKSTSVANQVEKTEFRYPIDFAVASPENIYQGMVNDYVLTPVVEAKSYLLTGAATEELSTVKQHFSGAGFKLYLPNSVVTQKGPAGTNETRALFQSYDAKGNILMMSKEGGAKTAYLWDYNDVFPIAEVKLPLKPALGPEEESVLFAYTSFETTQKGNWTYTAPTETDATVPTGTKCLNINGYTVSRAVSSNDTYIVSAWLKNGSGTLLFNGTAGVQIDTRNGWTCYEKEIASATSITISGTGKIDELRLFPKGALMTTQTYIPYVGISSSCAPNHQLTRYEYTYFNRLERVLDGDRNILKQYQYEYNTAITADCTNTSPNWVTINNAYCQLTTNGNYTGNVGVLEQDKNNCSPTFGSTRFTVTGTSSPCTPLPYCAGKIVNGVCIGIKERVLAYSYYDGSTWHCGFYNIYNDDSRGPLEVFADLVICTGENVFGD